VPCLTGWIGAAETGRWSARSSSTAWRKLMPSARITQSMHVPPALQAPRARSSSNANSASLTFVPTDFVRSGGFIEHRRRWDGDSGRTPPVLRLERQQGAGGGLRGCVS
jgi:hypothetical protein